MQQYEQGPFPGEPVCEVPDLMIELIERFTGRPYDQRAHEEYERIRAYVGYQGVLITPTLHGRQLHVGGLGAVGLGRLAAPAQNKHGGPPGSTVEEERRIAPPRAGFDPSDLGD